MPGMKAHGGGKGRVKHRPVITDTRKDRHRRAIIWRAPWARKSAKVLLDYMLSLGVTQSVHSLVVES